MLIISLNNQTRYLYLIFRNLFSQLSDITILTVTIYYLDDNNNSWGISPVLDETNPDLGSGTSSPLLSSRPGSSSLPTGVIPIQYSTPDSASGVSPTLLRSRPGFPTCPTGFVGVKYSSCSTTPSRGSLAAGGVFPQRLLLLGVVWLLDLLLLRLHYSFSGQSGRWISID